ncbi:hypothetical protein U6B65_14690 (plasmid) [Oscillospiraceae bacterium MB08-C2-2]|nr:hypothetical protein U6B65_14690 [Oscillospiraceae bacterium MB08-C2-2]
MKKKAGRVLVPCLLLFIGGEDSSMKKRKLYLTTEGKIQIIGIILFALFCLVISLFYRSGRQFEPEKLIIQVGESEEKCRVYVEDILKEAGKEDVYIIGLGNIGGTAPSGSPMEIPESVYNAKIGKEHNVLTMTTYTLTIMYPTPLYFRWVLILPLGNPLGGDFMQKRFKRSDFYGEEPFTYENSKELIKETVENFRYRLENESDLIDMSSTSNNYESNVDWLTLYLQENPSLN